MRLCNLAPDNQSQSLGSLPMCSVARWPNIREKSNKISVFHLMRTTGKNLSGINLLSEFDVSPSQSQFCGEYEVLKSNLLAKAVNASFPSDQTSSLPLKIF